MVLDYSKVCAYCSTPMIEPPRDGNRSICAPLHTPQGTVEFERIMKANRERKAIADAVTSPSTPPEVVTVSGDFEPSGDRDVVTFVNAVTTDDDEVTSTNFHPGAVTETKQQRYRRLNKERINQAERDRRNHA